MPDCVLCSYQTMTAHAGDLTRVLADVAELFLLWGVLVAQ